VGEVVQNEAEGKNERGRNEKKDSRKANLAVARCDGAAR
jgi:hypothetical protein